jgi:hypothetical protein
MGEVASGAAIRFGEGDPQLHAMQYGSRLDRHFGVTYPRARGHQVELAGPDHGLHTGTVAVLQCPAEQPADCLQSRVRMGRYVHAGGDGPVVIDKAPRSDQRALPLRQGALDPKCSRAAQRNLARVQYFDARGPCCATDEFAGRGLEIAHRPPFGAGSMRRYRDTTGARQPVVQSTRATYPVAVSTAWRRA